ncbi:DUF2059 domain-containing protein [Roseovarius spongiae]|uniref:DUF2059 domain-containing protein n=2 Tax=Roseovarius spongiae TaxID=2320272 RepID=A0A3A8BCA9_9RHOB|nr:DUF2059 domain-containing protein [Roseovarius spongiae]
MARVIGALAVLAALALGGASLRAQERPDLEAFLKVTGFDVALESIALSAREAPAMLGMSVGDFGEDWTRAAEEVFAPDLLRGIALDILDQTLTEDMLAAASEFYATSLGQRLVAAENASHMDADAAARQERGAALLEAATPERVALLTRLTEAVDSAGIAIDAVREVQVRFLLAASAAGVTDRRIDEETLRRILSASDAELRENLKENGLNGAAATYEEFTESEIATYAEALEASDMQRVYELMNAIQFEIMAERFEALALRMADMSAGQEL